MIKKRIAIFGAGGFAREVAWLIREINGDAPAYEFAGFIVSDISTSGEYDSKQEVLGDVSWLEANRSKIDCLAIGIGTPGPRLKIADTLAPRFPEIEWPALIHPRVIYDAHSWQIGRGVLICAGVIGSVNISVAEFTMINLGCTIGHEARLGRGCVLNPTVNISGGVVLEDGVLVGVGAQILQYIRVRARATVGAGAVVTKEVAEGEIVVGIPARSLKRA
jgi:sugar O-acyltransferase (sialic acid O-acetyltransferase NeuD family)